MSGGTAAEEVADGLLCERRGALALITLARPEKRNALTIAARARLAENLPKYARDPLVYAVVIRSAVEGIFCSGGDVIEMATLADQDIEAVEKALGDEISLVWLAECFTKPTVSLINGPVMGGGNGISRFGTHRVAGEHYKCATPETGIGFIPNYGLAHTFSRMPKDIGMYMALTGESIGAADAYHLGIATHCIPASEHDTIMAALVDAEPVDPLLDTRHRDPGPAPILALGEVITRTFGAGTVAEIITRLERERGAYAAWAEATRARLLERSPTALAVTHRLVREASAMQLSEVLELEHAVACRMMELPDIHAGVRARLIARGERPNWRPARIEEVSAAMLDAIFSPTEAHHVRLPARQKMQEMLA
ncbi:enoyl-CoA hydratase/isomerase family protein [Hyphomicrobium sp. CS1BSMeth3]|uniref:enoyl-CoA hydratase/isomerase family protein n=1 Tax=Hyphomicrobium sp. CS1BSMeth3 TaxID=1892844 RepID=UPI0009309461|nr:enoyl-CoA hydratase/isomerase family protein [Hyphomicrobium sp. CS1BSMeth3]